MHTFIHPFFYSDLIKQTLENAALTRILFYGGRGLGKTMLLRRIQRGLLRTPGNVVVPPNEKNDIFWVDGRHAEARARIGRWCDEPKGVLIIDNFDHVFDKTIDDALLNLPDVDEVPYRIVAASRRPPRVLERKVLQEKAGQEPVTAWDDSRSLTTFQFHRLNPWDGDWRARLHSEHDAAIRRLQDLLNPLIQEKAGGSKLPFPGPAELRLWSEVVVEVSGGYPRLVDGAFALLVAMIFNALARDGWISPDDASNHPLRQRCPWEQSLTLQDLGLVEGFEATGVGAVRGRVRNLLEDFLLERQMAPIELTLTNLKASEAKAFTAILELARNPDTVQVDDAKLRELLLDSGLTRKDPVTRRLYVPDGLIRTTICGMDDSQADEPPAVSAVAPERLQIRSMTVADDATVNDGTVLLDTTGGPRDVTLSGRPWQVFFYLWNNRDRLVPHAELMEKIPIKSEGAARNALTRLKDEFRRVGVGDVVENQKGAGYKIGQ
jgi:hypothetical protein